MPVDLSSRMTSAAMATLRSRTWVSPLSTAASTARLARNIDKPRLASTRVAEMVSILARAGRSTNSTGEPDRLRSTSRTGASRANRSFNDDFVIAHPLHHDIGDQPPIGEPYRVGLNG